MFDSLSDQIRRDEHLATNNLQRAIQYTVVVVLSVVLFGALYMAVRMFE